MRPDGAVKLRDFDPLAKRFGPSVVVGRGLIDTARVSLDQSGTAVVARNDLDGVWARSYSLTTQAFGTTQKIADAGTAPVRAWSDDRGHAFVAFASNSEMGMRMWSADTDSWGAPMDLGGRALATTPGGGAVLQELRGPDGGCGGVNGLCEIWILRFDASIGRWDEGTFLAPAPGDGIISSTPDIARDGTTYAAWRHADPVTARRSVHVSRYDPNAQTWGDIVRVNTDPMTSVISFDIEADDNGNAVVVWAAGAPVLDALYDVYASRWKCW